MNTLTVISLITIIGGSWVLGFNMGQRVGFRRATELLQPRNPE